MGIASQITQITFRLVADVTPLAATLRGVGGLVSGQVGVALAALNSLVETSTKATAASVKKQLVALDQEIKTAKRVMERDLKAAEANAKAADVALKTANQKQDLAAAARVATIGTRAELALKNLEVTQKKAFEQATKASEKFVASSAKDFTQFTANALNVPVSLFDQVRTKLAHSINEAKNETEKGIRSGQALLSAGLKFRAVDLSNEIKALDPVLGQLAVKFATFRNEQQRQGFLVSVFPRDTDIQKQARIYFEAFNKEMAAHKGEVASAFEKTFAGERAAIEARKVAQLEAAAARPPLQTVGVSAARVQAAQARTDFVATSNAAKQARIDEAEAAKVTIAAIQSQVGAYQGLINRLREVAAEQGRFAGLAAGGANILEFFTTTVGAAVLAVAALAVAIPLAYNALLNALEVTLKWNAQLFNLSDKSGISARNIQIFALAANEAGTSMNIVQRSLDQFVTRMEAAASSEGKLRGVFELLGVKPADGLKRMDAALITVIEHLNQITDAGVRAAFAQNVFGLRNEEIIPVITRLGKSYDEILKRYPKFVVETEEAIKISKQYQVVIGSQQIANTSIANHMIVTFVPAIILVKQAFVDLTFTISGLIQPITGTKNVFVELAKAVQFTAALLGEIVTNLSAVVESILAVEEVILVLGTRGFTFAQKVEKIGEIYKRTSETIVAQHKVAIQAFIDIGKLPEVELQARTGALEDQIEIIAKEIRTKSDQVQALIQEARKDAQAEDDKSKALRERGKIDDAKFIEQQQAHLAKATAIRIAQEKIFDDFVAGQKEKHKELLAPVDLSQQAEKFKELGLSTQKFTELITSLAKATRGTSESSEAFTERLRSLATEYVAAQSKVSKPLVSAIVDPKLNALRELATTQVGIQKLNELITKEQIEARKKFRDAEREQATQTEQNELEAIRLAKKHQAELLKIRAADLEAVIEAERLAKLQISGDDEEFFTKRLKVEQENAEKIRIARIEFLKVEKDTKRTISEKDEIDAQIAVLKGAAVTAKTQLQNRLDTFEAFSKDTTRISGKRIQELQDGLSRELAVLATRHAGDVLRQSDLAASAEGFSLASKKIQDELKVLQRDFSNLESKAKASGAAIDATLSDSYNERIRQARLQLELLTQEFLQTQIILKRAAEEAAATRFEENQQARLDATGRQLDLEANVLDLQKEQVKVSVFGLAARREALENIAQAEAAIAEKQAVLANRAAVESLAARTRQAILDVSKAGDIDPFIKKLQISLITQESVVEQQRLAQELAEKIKGIFFGLQQELAELDPLGIQQLRQDIFAMETDFFSITANLKRVTTAVLQTAYAFGQTGKVGIAALRGLAAATIQSFAQMAGAHVVKEVAHAISDFAAAADPIITLGIGSAAYIAAGKAHLVAAAKWGLLAAGASIAAGAVAGGGGGAAAGESAGGRIANQPRSSQFARGDITGLLGGFVELINPLLREQNVINSRLVDQQSEIGDTLAQIQGIPPGHVLTMAADQQPLTFSRGIRSALASDGALAGQMGRHILGDR